MSSNHSVVFPLLFFSSPLSLPSKANTLRLASLFLALRSHFFSAISHCSLSLSLFSFFFELPAHTRTRTRKRKAELSRPLLLGGVHFPNRLSSPTKSQPSHSQPTNQPTSTPVLHEGFKLSFSSTPHFRPQQQLPARKTNRRIAPHTTKASLSASTPPSTSSPQPPP